MPEFVSFVVRVRVLNLNIRKVLAAWGSFWRNGNWDWCMAAVRSV